MAVAAPVIEAEMADWVALGGRNSGIVGNDAHRSGFHRAANEVPATDYSRRRDPNGADGPYVNWSYACAGDFWHGDDPELLAQHRRLLARLEAGELPMICEFIGQPWPDQPVIYWSRWGGRSVYQGSGHGTWSHISWYRSRANQRAYLWQENDMTKDEAIAAARIGVHGLLKEAAAAADANPDAEPTPTGRQVRDYIRAIVPAPVVEVDYNQLADAIVRRAFGVEQG